LGDALKSLAAFIASPSAQAGLHYTKNILETDVTVDPDVLRAAIQQRDLDRLAAWWANGLTIDWDLLQAGRRAKRVSLPAYPFERVRCWYPEYPDAPSVVNPLGSRLKFHPFVGANQSD